MSAANIRLIVVTPEKIVVDDNARIIMAPGVKGEFGILAGHTPFLTSLKTGALKYVDGDGRERYVFISGGFAEALPDKVTILAETAERRLQIDLERARDAYERALKRIEKSAIDRESVDILRAKMAMFRALQRIQIAQSSK